ncbi:MAG: type II toxin-antitoxin system prevent-host-death family antitoxin [Gemmatimonadetes bacterium]|nr:type II toxin-antitoxin system prevent-host-death family antitoxin [Gemmatimonadota bacterium]
MKEPREKRGLVGALKARLGEYIRAARRGCPVVVCNRDAPVKRLIPYEARRDALRVRRPIRHLRDVAFGPPLRAVESLSHLLDERQPGR